MAKELPYFKFEPAEYLTKDISFCSLPAQGLFINICSYYWQRNCELTKEQLLRRLNHETELNELIKEGVIDLVGNDIHIKFLDNQLNEVENKSKTNSVNGSKGGRPKKNPTESETKPKLNLTESETKGIREDKIIEDDIITPSAFSFYNELINLGAEKQLVSDWIKVRKTKKATNTETAFNKFVNQLNKSGYTINEVLEKCVEKSWGGFDAEWYSKSNKQNTTHKPLTF